MAGNNSIQFLRGSGTSNNAQLLPGQPYYDYVNNQLYIGGFGGTAINRAVGIGSKKLNWFKGLSGGGMYMLLGVFSQSGIYTSSSFINSIPSTQSLASPAIEGIGWILGNGGENSSYPVYGYGKYNVNGLPYVYYVKKDGTLDYSLIESSALTYLI